MAESSGNFFSPFHNILLCIYRLALFSTLARSGIRGIGAQSDCLWQLLDLVGDVALQLQCASVRLLPDSNKRMPIKWVLHWQPNVGTMVNSQILNEVSQCVESVNGVKDGRWKATLTFYRPNLRDQSLQADFPRDFLGISLLEQPNKYYFIIRGQRIVLEADSTILTIMEKLQSYKSKVALNFEGLLYRLGDFQLRVGKVAPSNSESLRGIVLEVEYLPISSIEKSRQVMEEFLSIWQEAVSKKSLPGQFMHMEPNYAEYGLLDCYTSQHTAVQYATVLAKLIATVQPVQPMRN